MQLVGLSRGQTVPPPVVPGRVESLHYQLFSILRDLCCLASTSGARDCPESFFYHFTLRGQAFPSPGASFGFEFFGTIKFLSA